MLKIPPGVEQCIPRADMSELSPADYRTLGVAVLRRAMSAPAVARLQSAWDNFRATGISSGRTISSFNPVVLNETVTGELAAIYRHPELLDIMERIYPDLGVFGQRFVIKDHQSRAPVFYHQDYSYDLGWPEKTSVFLPLSPMNPGNGGLRFLPGSHLGGYLGDAGEIDIEAVAPGWPIFAPSLDPGDIVLMHECTWHGSGPHVTGADRIVVQIQYQPASDPSSFELLRGTDNGLLKLPEAMRHLIFKRSRASRLNELQAELQRLNAQTVA